MPANSCNQQYPEGLLQSSKGGEKYRYCLRCERCEPCYTNYIYGLFITKDNYHKVHNLLDCHYIDIRLREQTFAEVGYLVGYSVPKQSYRQICGQK